MNAEDLPLLNSEHLASFRDYPSTDEKPVLVQLVEMFDTDTPTRLTKIKSQLDAKNYEAARREAHTLKSGCSMLGAERMTWLCERLETATEEEIRTKGQAYFEKLSRTFPETLSLLKKEIALPVAA